MKKILILALLGMMGSNTQAIEMKLVAGDDRGADMNITLALSETGMVSIYMTMFERDGNVTFISGFLDATPLGNDEAVGYDVLGSVFKMVRNDGTEWFRNMGRSDSFNIEDYWLNAADREGDGFTGTDAPWKGVVDSIVIHGTEIGEYDLYYENDVTAEDDPRPPNLFDRDNVRHNYTRNEQAPALLWFKNAWADPEANGGNGFDVPFVVNVTPEPASLGLLAVGGLALLRRRN